MKRTILIAFLSIACGTDDPVDPSGVDLSGAWTYVVTGLGTPATGCVVNGTQLLLTQVDNTFTGAATGGRLVCADNFGFINVDRTLLSQAVTNGSLVGTAVSFELEPNAWVHTGSVSEDRMEGSLMGLVGGQMMSGNWSATR